MERTNNIFSHRGSGFTLVEVLVVLAIVSILAGMAWPSYAKHQRQAIAREGALSLLMMASVQERVRIARGAYQPAEVIQGLRQLPDRVADVYQLDVELANGGRHYQMTLLPIQHNSPYQKVSLDSLGRRAPSSIWP